MFIQITFPWHIRNDSRHQPRRFWEREEGLKKFNWWWNWQWIYVCVTAISEQRRNGTGSYCHDLHVKRHSKTYGSYHYVGTCGYNIYNWWSAYHDHCSKTPQAHPKSVRNFEGSQHSSEVTTKYPHVVFIERATIQEGVSYLLQACNPPTSEQNLPSISQNLFLVVTPDSSQYVQQLLQQM